MKFYSTAAMGPEYDAPGGPEFTIHVQSTPHGRTTSYGPYAFAESALSDMLDWVYGLNAHAGWVTDHEGRTVASAPTATAHAEPDAA